MAAFNRRTIILKIPNLHKQDSQAKLEADALEALLVSANPIRSDYDLDEKDYELIENERKKIELIVDNMVHHLKKKAKK